MIKNAEYKEILIIFITQIKNKIKLILIVIEIIIIQQKQIYSSLI